MAKRISLFGAAGLLLWAGCIKDYDFNNPIDPRTAGYRQKGGLAVAPDLPGYVGQGVPAGILTDGSEIVLNIFNAYPDSLDLSGLNFRYQVGDPVPWLGSSNLTVKILQPVNNWIDNNQSGTDPEGYYTYGNIGGNLDTLKIGVGIGPSGYGGENYNYWGFLDTVPEVRVPLTAQVVYQDYDGPEKTYVVVQRAEPLVFRHRLAGTAGSAVRINTAASSVALPLSRDSLLYSLGVDASHGFDSSAFRIDSTGWKIFSFRALSGRPRADFTAQAVGGGIYALGGMKSGGSPDTAVDQFDTLCQSVVLRGAFKRTRASLASASTGGKIYVLGGSDNFGNTRRFDWVDEYDPAQDTWMAKAPLSSPRHGMAAEAVGNKVYVMGGTADSGSSDSVQAGTVEEYDPLTDTWFPKAPMPTPRTGLACAKINGKLYAIGGMSETRPQPTVYHGTVEEFEPDSNRWAAKAPLTVRRTHLGAVAVNGKIYAIGGDSNIYSNYNISTVEEYDPLSNQWVLKSPMPTPRSRFGIAVVDGKIYVIGGFTAGNYQISTVEKYDPSTDTWTRVHPLRQGDYFYWASETNWGGWEGFKVSSNPYLLTSTASDGFTPSSINFDENLVVLDLVFFVRQSKIRLSFPLLPLN